MKNNYSGIPSSEDILGVKNFDSASLEKLVLNLSDF